MTGSTREIKLRMSIEADASKGSQALQQLANDAQRTEQAAKNASAALRDMGPGGGMAGGAAVMDKGVGGGGGKGLIESALSFANPIAAATALVATAANLTTAFQNLDNGFLSVQERALGVVRALPLVGDSIANFLSTLSSASERLFDEERAKRVDRAQYDVPIRIGQNQAMANRRMQNYGLTREVSEAGFRSQAARDFPTVASQQSLFAGSVGGMFGAHLNAAFEGGDPRTLASAEAVQSAERRLSVARMAAGASQTEVDAARGQTATARSGYDAAKAEYDKVLAATRGEGVGHREGAYRKSRDSASKEFGSSLLGDFGSELAGGIGYLFPTWTTGKTADDSSLALRDASLKLAEKEAALKRENAELEAKVAANKERQLSVVTQMNEREKEITNSMRTRLSILDEELSRARTGARQLGGMDEVSQDALLRSARRFKEGGRENVTEGEFNLLANNQLTQKLVSNRLDDDVSKNPIYKAILDLAGERRADVVKAERDKLKAEVSMKVQFDEEQFAKQMEEALKKINFKDIIGIIVENKFKLEFGAVERGILGAKAGGG